MPYFWWLKSFDSINCSRLKTFILCNYCIYMIKTKFITWCMRIKRVRIKFKLWFIRFVLPVNRFFLKRSNFEILHYTDNWRSVLRFFVKHSNNDLGFILINLAVKRRRRVVNDIYDRFDTSSSFKRMNFIIRLIKQYSKQKYISLFCEMCSFMRLKLKYFWCFVSVIFCFVPVCLDERIKLIFNSFCCKDVKFDCSVAHYAYLIWS